MNCKGLLKSWVLSFLNEDGKRWLQEQEKKFDEGPSDNQVHISFSSAIRYSKKHPLKLSTSDVRQAEKAVAGWMPNYWTQDEALRIYLLLCLPSLESQKTVSLIESLYQSGDVRECSTVLKTLPLLPVPQNFLNLAKEGARSNMRVSYEAIAHYNVYPKLNFDESAWNQLVLKALFIEAPLYPILGLDQRVNAPLRDMLLDYARERWAASRAISPELWRCVGPLATEKELSDLEKAFQTDNNVERCGVGLALASCPLPRAQEILATNPDLEKKIKDSALTWNSLLLK